MSTDPLQARIAAPVDQFVLDITQLVREAAFEALETALGGADSAPIRVRGHRKPASSLVEVIMTPAPAGKVTPPRSEPAPSFMPSTRPEPDDPGEAVDLEKFADTIVRLLVESHGLRGEEMARLLGVASEDVKPALAALRAEGRVVASGWARGTRHTVAALGSAERDGSAGPGIEGSDTNPQAVESI